MSILDDDKKLCAKVKDADSAQLEDALAFIARARTAMPILLKIADAAMDIVGDQEWETQNDDRTYVGRLVNALRAYEASGKAE